MSNSPEDSAVEAFASDDWLGEPEVSPTVSSAVESLRPVSTSVSGWGGPSSRLASGRLASRRVAIKVSGSEWGRSSSRLVSG